MTVAPARMDKSPDQESWQGHEKARDASGGVAAAKPSSDRAARFLVRVDKHLRALADDAARRAFLSSQLDGWERRYFRFVRTQGASEPASDHTDPPQATDFVATIAALAARRHALDDGRPSDPC
jgi:hypothetical protein